MTKRTRPRPRRVLEVNASGRHDGSTTRRLSAELGEALGGHHGAVSVGSDVDFPTPRLRQALDSLGITEVEFIAADGLDGDPDRSFEGARRRIVETVTGAGIADSRAA